MKEIKSCEIPTKLKVFQNYLICFYKGIVRLAFNMAILILIFSLGIGIWKTFKDLALVLVEPTVRESFRELITNVLSLIVVLELIRAFVDYFEYEMVRVEILIEVLIAFLIREFMIHLFEGSLTGLEVFLWGLAIVLVVLSRISSVFYRSFKIFKTKGLKEFENS